MAEEVKIEELPGGEAPKEAGGAPSPWIPLILVLVLTPVLTILAGKFVLIPELMQKFKDEAHKTEAENSPNSEEKKEASGPLTRYNFDNIVANLAGALHSRYVKVSFTIEGRAGNFKEVIDGNKAKLIDATLSLLSSYTLVDLEQPGIQNLVRSDLLSAFESALSQDIVQNLFFSEFVVQ